MMLLARILLNGLAILVVAAFVPGVAVHGYTAALLAGLAIAVANACLRPILQILALPVTILTLGLFALVINAFLFWLASTVVPGFIVNGFAAAFWGSIVFSLMSMMTGHFLRKEGV